MTYEQIVRYRPRRAHQCGTLSDTGRCHHGRSCSGDDGQVRGLQKTGIPVPGGGTEDKAQGARPGAQGRVHREASRESRIFFAARRGFHRGIIERSCCTGPEDILEKKGVWPKSVLRSRCFTATIAWATRRLHKSTGCLFRRKSGRTG